MNQYCRSERPRCGEKAASNLGRDSTRSATLFLTLLSEFHRKEKKISSNLKTSAAVRVLSTHRLCHSESEYDLDDSLIGK